MFDIGASELLVVVIVAIVVIGPKDLPLALRTAGRWIGRIRRVSGHFRAGIETMIREAELEDMERKWREQNAAIIAASGAADAGVPPAADTALADFPPVDDPHAVAGWPDAQPLAEIDQAAEPTLPLGEPRR
jgi:sec-independent protein translocase protein TatB